MTRDNKKAKVKKVLEIIRDSGITIDDLIMVIEDSIEEGFVESVCEENNTVSLEYKISELLREIGMPAKLNGYDYVRYSIIYVLENPKAIHKITKDLYPTIAEEYKTTSSRVERSIRHAIEVSWNRGDTEIFQEYFGYSIDANRGKPTNGEFIARLVDHIRLGG